MDDQRLRDFVALVRRVRHDANNPLTAALGHVQLLLDEPVAVRHGGVLERADVLLESFRPGTLARLGFPPDLLRERHPRLVVCSVSGWGQSGPWAARAGHDLTYQAVAGSLAERVTATEQPGKVPASTTKRESRSTRRWVSPARLSRRSTFVMMAAPPRRSWQFAALSQVAVACRRPPDGSPRPCARDAGGGGA